MKTIILMRHAHAAKSSGSDRDFDRPLTADGHTIATRTAVALNHAGVRLDRIICSSSARTRQTAEIVATVTEFFGPSDFSDELYLAESSQIAIVTAQSCEADDDTVLVVGHNPGMAALIGRLHGDSVPVPPSTAAVFETDLKDWQDFSSISSVTCTLKRMIRDGETVL